MYVWNYTPTNEWQIGVVVVPGVLCLVCEKGCVVSHVRDQKEKGRLDEGCVQWFRSGARALFGKKKRFSSIYSLFILTPKRTSEDVKCAPLQRIVLAFAFIIGRRNRYVFVAASCTNGYEADRIISINFLFSVSLRKKKGKKEKCEGTTVGTYYFL